MKSQSKWTCAGCGMSVRQIDGLSMPLPGHWELSTEGPVCLICRERAAKAAILAAGEDGRESHAEIRKAAVIEFEVRRTPELSNSAIARTCQCAPLAVAAVRERLCLPEPLLLAPLPRRGPASVGAPSARRSATRRVGVRG